MRSWALSLPTCAKCRSPLQRASNGSACRVCAGEASRESIGAGGNAEREALADFLTRKSTGGRHLSPVSPPLSPMRQLSLSNSFTSDKRCVSSSPHSSPSSSSSRGSSFNLATGGRESPSHARPSRTRADSHDALTVPREKSPLASPEVLSVPLTERPSELILEALPPVHAVIERQTVRTFVRSVHGSTAALALLPVGVPRKDSSSSQDSAQASEHEGGEPMFMNLRP